ncbi:putative oxidoreductase YteT isoform X3 [Mercenaria mercenaria]|uniref:putative oxidoreductase YteT isoform X3 n=1 Tax=Mercenaria mercenaria TaxID=6596 RepID=UPI00234F852F|nr:putative oxidoreductase YteT isoform X3 [Mercenaria mercenaria]
MTDGVSSFKGGHQSKAKTYSAKSDQTREREPDKPSSIMEEEIGSGTPKTTIIVGAGSRGHGYPYYAVVFPKQLKVVGVCEPRDHHRQHEVKQHNIPPENVFKDWKEAAEREKFADSVIICTPDRLHKDPAIAFAKKGYHILLEKPMAVTEADCKEIVATVKENNVILAVCHVMRYMSWVKKVKEIIDSGVIGDVVNINHTEPVGFWHFAHSYVRGNWHVEADSSFSLLAKCCHDVDLISYWMRGKPCQRVSSFGNLSHFHKGDKPEGAAYRCLDCPVSIENNCPYSAKKIYLDRVKQGHRGWPTSVLCDIVDIENVTDALRKGPYGKCVYDTDNDVMSHQVVNMQFEGGATATLQMVAFTKKLCAREVKIYGTKGEITVNDGELPPIKVFNFLTHKTDSFDPEDEMAPLPLMGHGGADYQAIKAFVTALHDQDSKVIETGPDDTLASHILCFAAERARKENRVLNRNSQGEFE